VASRPIGTAGRLRREAPPLGIPTSAAVVLGEKVVMTWRGFA
jgi:hypothetical protein